MACACEQCRQHARTLGLEAGAASREATRKAYRDAVKLWHPDRFEGDPGHKPDAEEHFRQVQAAYSTLTDHNRSPVVLSLEPFAARPARPAALSFGSAPGVFTAPRLPPQVEQIVASRLAADQKALAIVDLSRDGTAAGDFSKFLLLASHAVIVCNGEGNDSILWYTDLGDISLVDHRKDGKLGVWQTVLEKVSGTEQKYTLHIQRRNGAPFFSLAAQADDSVKKVIYNFLRHKKYQPQV